MRIAHISDFHLPTEAGQRVKGALPDANLIEAVSVLKRQVPGPDLVVLGGDLLDEGQKGNYETIAELFRELQVPIHPVVGNHDDLKALKNSSLLDKERRASGYGSFDHEGLHVILLNTGGTGKSYGNIEEQQLFWLSEDLYRNHGKPVMIFMHHHPIDSGIPWLDKMKLQNADAFWEIVPPYSQNILGVFFAHLHIQLTTVVRGVPVASPPAVCFQFSGNNEAAKAELSDEQPGFNLIDVHNLGAGAPGAGTPGTGGQGTDAGTVRLRSVRLRTVRFAPAVGSTPASGSGEQTRQRAEPSSAGHAAEKKS